MLASTAMTVSVAVVTTRWAEPFAKEIEEGVRFGRPFFVDHGPEQGRRPPGQRTTARKGVRFGEVGFLLLVRMCLAGIKRALSEV